MRCADYYGHMSGIVDNRVTAMATPVDVEAVISGAQGRIIGALLRVDGPRTISEMARLADVSRDRAATVVTRLERLGLIERRPAGRAHLVALIEENPVTESLREIECRHERSVELGRLNRRQSSWRCTARGRVGRRRKPPTLTSQSSP
jgi:DNA-binding MarR family transcriptional regulator